MARFSCIVLLSMCALAAAMVPRERESVSPEKDLERGSKYIQLPDLSEGNREPLQLTTTEDSGICEENMACSWLVYIRFERTPDYNITNACVCGPGTTCKYYYDNISISAYEYRCMPSS